MQKRNTSRLCVGTGLGAGEGDMFLACNGLQYLGNITLGLSS